MTSQLQERVKRHQAIVERQLGLSLSRAERETRAVSALCKKREFAPGLFGYEREQMALIIVRVVLDVEDGKA